MRNYWKDGNPANCCGCGACETICPKSCIKLVPNTEGFLYPAKEESVCINCRLCEKVCPFSDNYVYEATETPSVCAAYDEINRIGSSSGGIFYALSKYVIEKKKGIVYGAAFNENFQLVHMGVDRLAEIQKLRGSKYLQSKIGDSYSEVRNHLSRNKFVMFVGTPCQIAGLRGFLRKDYDNLLLVDLVCHGVPPQSLFDEHVKYLERKHHATLVSYYFRDLERWGGCEITDFANPKKRKILPSYSLSPYLYSFMQAYTYRESCYECKFAKIPRQGDITLADYWGVNKFFPSIDDKKGVSLVLSNTHVGEKFLGEALKECKVFQSNLEDASKYNTNLITRTPRPEIRNKIFSMIHEKGYEKISRTIFRVKNYHLLRIKLFLKSFK